MSNIGDNTPNEKVSRLLEIVGQNVKGPDVPSEPPAFDKSQVSWYATDLKSFWPSATNVLHNLAPQSNAVGSVSVLLDFAIAVYRSANDSRAVELFALQEEALQVLSLSKMRQMIRFLELRKAEWIDYAQGEASIVLLRTGRTLLNRLEPRLHAHDTGRVITYLALSKGIAHASRLNRKGLSNSAYIKPVPGAEFSIEYAVSSLQSPATLTTSADLEQFLSNILQRLTRFTLESDLGDVRAWATLTWEEAQKTLNGLIFVFLLAFALPVIRKTTNSNAQQLVERVESRLDKIIGTLDLSAAIERLATRESEWTNWRQQQYAKPEKAPVELVMEPSEPRLAALSVPSLEKSLGNENLTRLWSVSTGLGRFEETVDWAGKAEEFETKSKDDNSYKFMALRCRPWTELVSSFASAPIEEYDMSKWEAKLPKEPVPTREPLKRTNEQSESAPKRARVSYEEVDRTASVDRQRAMASTARPLPY